MRTPRRSDGTAVIRVRVQPRASRDEVLGWQDDTLRVRVTAPPVEGEANDAVALLIARAAGLPRSAVRVVAGAQSRDKLVEITGVDSDVLRARFR